MSHEGSTALSDMTSMNFRIADSFTAALTRLTGQEQKQAKTAAFDLQLKAMPNVSFPFMVTTRNSGNIIEANISSHPALTPFSG